VPLHRRVRSPSPGPLAAFFTLAGTLHFTHTKRYEATMPPYIPAHREMVLLSGVAEIAGGLGTLHPATRRAAGWGLVALLVAVFPANVHMALHPDEVRGVDVPRWVLWARLPLQPLCIAWTLAATRR